MSTIGFSAAALAFLYGFVTEWRQSRRGPNSAENAIVPTLPWAVAAAMFVMLGALCTGWDLAWWAYPLLFLGCAVLFGYAIAWAGKADFHFD
jgi:hypothetical protein